MNIGFNLWAYTGDDKIKLNNALIPSKLTDSLAPQDYSQRLDISGISGDVKKVALSTIDVMGTEEFHGPFDLGEKHGETPKIETINWDNIRSGIENKLSSKGLSLKGNSLRTSGKSNNSLLIKTSAKNGGGNSNNNPTEVCNIAVNEQGITRVTYQQLLDAGCGFSGVSPSDIALTYKGQAVSRKVITKGKFGAGSYIDFYAELPKGVDSLYLLENTYQIRVDDSLVKESKSVNKKPSGSDSSYTETAVRHNNILYSFTMPAPNDPWYENQIFSNGSPVSRDYSISTEIDAITSEPAALKLGLTGAIAPSTDNDHHVMIYFNGTFVGEFFNDGFVDWVLDIPLPANSIVAGENIITLEVVGDVPFGIDIVNFNFAELSYERPYSAISDKLQFTENINSDFIVNALSTDNTVAYGFDGADLYSLKANTAGSGTGFDAAVAGVKNGSAVNYWVSSEDKINSASVSLARSNTDILEGSADYLIVSHPAFIGTELDGYVQNKEAEGYSVKVVDLLDIYDDHGHGIATPFTIREYLIDADSALGFTHVLFIGADSYDYHDYTNSGVISFLPTMYSLTNFLLYFTPSDSLIVDLNGDETPDKSYGRWPVRTIGDLNTIINKTAAYSSQIHDSALLIAEHASGVGVPFKDLTDGLEGSLPWDSSNNIKVYVDNILAADPALTVSQAIVEASNQMVSAINNGISFSIFAGHGAPTMWTFNGLMTPTIAGNLANAGKPTFIMPLACYTTYHVLPTINSLSHQLSVSGDRGGAVVTGASALSSYAANELVAQGIIDKMVNQDKTLGQAILEALDELGSGGRDTRINWMNLGDPTLKINQ